MMPVPGQRYQILEKELDGATNYTAVIGCPIETYLPCIVKDYTRKALNYSVLIVDYRKGNPVIEPHDIAQFFEDAGDIWDKPECFIYLYNDANRMRTAHLSKLILMRGGRVVALPSWQAAAEHLGRDLGDDPLETLQP